MAIDNEEIKKDATVKIKKSLPVLVFIIVAAVLIYVFGNLIFTPLAVEITLYGKWPLDTVISFVILVVLIMIVLRAIIDLRKIADGISTFFAIEIGSYTKKYLKKYIILIIWR